MKACATNVAVEKQYVLRILSLCLYPLSSSMQSACAILYFHLWAVRIYTIYPHYLIPGAIWGAVKGGRKENVTESKTCVLIFCTNFV
jgi:hypothetical protein